MNRRSFLDPVPLLGLGFTPEALPVPSLSLLCATRKAMATEFEIMLPNSIHRAALAADAAFALIDALEDQLTVYREDSEVSRLNRTAALVATPVESRLFDLLEFAAQVGHATQGCFDIATGALIKAWGFYQRQGKVPTVAERIAAMQCSGMRYVILDPQLQTVRYLRSGLEINLGGIGKGYALDRAAERLRSEWGIASALLHGGSSSILAIGTPPGQPHGWTVSLRHPWEPGRSLGTVQLKNQAIGTSAGTHQHVDYNGRKLGHLLDPRTGWPAEQIQQATAIAPTAVEADALSTAFFVMGIEATRHYCAAHPGIAAILLPTGDEADAVVFNTTLSAEF